MSVADVPVAQLDRVLDSDSKGRTFEPCQARHKNHLTVVFLWSGISRRSGTAPVTLCLTPVFGRSGLR